MQNTSPLTAYDLRVVCLHHGQVGSGSPCSLGSRLAASSLPRMISDFLHQPLSHIRLSLTVLSAAASDSLTRLSKAAFVLLLLPPLYRGGKSRWMRIYA